MPSNVETWKPSRYQRDVILGMSRGNNLSVTKATTNELIRRGIVVAAGDAFLLTEAGEHLAQQIESRM